MLKFAGRGLRQGRFGGVAGGQFRFNAKVPAQNRFFGALAEVDDYAGLGRKYEDMTIGVPKETFPLERRVSQTPESVEKLVKAGFAVKVGSAENRH